MEKLDALSFLRGLPQIKNSITAQNVIDKLDAAGLKLKATAGKVHDSAHALVSKELDSARSARDLIAELVGRGFHIGSKD